MGKVLLVTGGATGIGAATARLAAGKGYAIAINYRTKEREALSLAAELQAAGSRAVAIQADISVPSDILRLYRVVDEKLGPVSALVNSAGMGTLPTRVDETDEVVLHRLFQTNVHGLILSSREAVRRMSSVHGGKGGVIVNVSSMASTIGGRPGASLYAASKGAVDAFTIGLAREVAAEGIRAVAVRPGFTITEMTSGYVTDSKRLDYIASTIPMGRAGAVDEVAKPIVWLLSEEASFVSGALFDISGGGFRVG
jgi:NAD(P)-dependent dehydrogenase (short-subunit alcohol dehydrogenase family)